MVFYGPFFMAKRYSIGFFLLIGLGGILSLYFWESLFQPSLMIERDLSIFFFPNIKLWVEAVQAGELPLWNPYSFSGQPLFASLQTSILYPPNLLLFLFSLDFGFNLTIILHFFLSGWFVFLLTRELEGSRVAGILAALSFTLGGFLISIHNVLNTLQSVTWTPLILFFFLRAFRLFSRKYIFLSAFCILIQFFGGGVEAFLLTQALIIFLTIFPGAFLKKSDISSPLLLQARASSEGTEEEKNFFLSPGYPPWKWRFQRVGLVYLLVFGLGAVQIFPFLEMAGLSDRYSGLSYALASNWSLNWRDILYVFFPDFFWRGTEYYKTDQNYLKSIYLGLIPVFLMFLFFILNKGRRKWWFLVLLIGSLALALGKNTPLFWTLYSFFPGASSLRYPVKFFFFTNLLICVLAGLGWDLLSIRFQTDSGKKLPWLKTVSVVGALFSVVAFAIIVLYQEPIIAFLDRAYPISYARPWGLNLHNIERFFFFSLWVFLFFLFLGDRKISCQKGPAFLIALLILDLFLANWGFYRRIDPKAYYALSPNLQTVLADPGPGRIYADPTLLKTEIPRKVTMEELTRLILKETFYFDYPLIHRIYNASGFGVMTYRPYQDLLNILNAQTSHPQTTDLLRLMNVRFILWHEKVDSSILKLIRKGESYVFLEDLPKTTWLHPPPRKQITPHLYENTEALPKAFLISNYWVVQNRKERINLLGKKGFNPARTILLEETPEPPGSTRGPVPDQDGVYVKKHGLNQIDIEAGCTGPRLLFLSETYYPGWKVWVDGKKGKIYRANHAFRAVALGPGRHNITFRYQPFSFYSGLAVSGLTLLGFLGWFMISRGKRP